jgi:hypothetical protein
VIQNDCGQVWQLCTKIYVATVWVGGTLNKRIREHQPIRNLQHVEELFLQEWELLPQEAISNLIRSMPRRCVELIRVRGDYTSY